MGYEVQTYDAGPLSEFDTFEEAVRYAGKVLDDILSDPDDNEEHVAICLNCSIADVGSISEIIRHDDEIDFERMSQPTAEWSRIQQLMKEHEWMKQFLEKLHIPCLLEADPVQSAEEFCDGWHSLVNEHKQAYLKLLSRLPKIGDGAVALWGDEVWFMDPDKDVFAHDAVASEKVLVIYDDSEIKEYGGEFTIGCGTFEAGNNEFFSSAESCRTAYGIEEILPPNDDGDCLEM